MKVPNWYNLVEKITNHLLVLFFSLFFIANTAFSACDVPICDIPKTIAELKEGTVESRANFLGDLFQKVKSLTNISGLQNIHKFSKLSYDLQKELKDPENILAWSLFLRELSIYNLLRLAPFELEEMKALYTESFEIPELSSDRQIHIRFDTLQRWRVQIGTIMDTKLIFNLYTFISFAQNKSETNKDEDYVLREIINILDILGKRLSYLYPSYEGVFEIKTRCFPDAPDCELSDLSSNRITLLNSITDLGIFSALFDSKDGTPSYMFYKSVIESFGTSIYTLSEVLTTTGRPSELYIQLNNTQDIKGYVLSSRYAGILRFEGKIIYSPIKFYTDEGSGNEKPIVTGKFEGKLGDQKATIIIRQKRNKTLMASMALGDQKDNINLNFTTGEFVEHRGIINLVGFPSQKLEPYKLNIAYRKSADGKYHWSGGFFSINGHFQKAEFIRSAEIDQPNPNDPLNVDPKNFNPK